MSWTEAELAGLKRAYASGTLRVSYDGKSVEYGSAADLLARIRTIEAEIAARPAARSRAAASPPSARGDPMNWLDRAIGAVAPGAGLRRARQRQMMAVLARAYEGARHGRRTEGWIAAGTGANAEIAPALARLRDRSRDLVRNNPYAGKAVQALVSNMVGTGLMPRARAADAGSARQADRLWLDFAATADADGLTDFAGLQALIVRGLVESGEVLVRLRERRVEDGLPVPLQLQVLEADHLDSWKTGELADGGFILQGIEFDALGRRRAYWLYPTHPGDGRGGAGLASGAGRSRAAPLRAAAARAGARRAVVRAGDAEAARPRRLRRGRAGAEEDRGLLRRLRHRRAGRGDPRQGAHRSRRQPASRPSSPG